ncbi:MAG TPA: isochorismatase family cysteine hydrolase [Pyrinomonadaceae bacterium]|nr:isochorismatase family cysteine hydrolase [Pyrinomonadaceae bacterium]
MANQSLIKRSLVNSRESALILIDVITDFEFEDGDELLKRTLPAAKNLAGLKHRAKRAGVPVIYVNDNFGKWQEDFKTMADHFARPDKKGHEAVQLLKPEHDDYYVLKPHRSAFYSTSLELLLRDLKAKTLIIAGVTTDICILFSANDAYMRGFDLYIPSDCVAAVTAAFSKQAMEIIKRVLKADTRRSTEISFRAPRRR